MGLSLREIEAVLAWLGVDCRHQAMWYWIEMLADLYDDPPTASASRIADDEKQIVHDGEKKWLYTTINLGPQLRLDVIVHSHRGTESTAALLHFEIPGWTTTIVILLALVGSDI